MLTMLTLAPSLSLAVALALTTYVVAEYCSQNEILFGCKLPKWLVCKEPNGIQAFGLAEIEVHAVTFDWLKQIVNVLVFQP